MTMMIFIALVLHVLHDVKYKNIIRWKTLAFHFFFYFFFRASTAASLVETVAAQLANLR